MTTFYAGIGSRETPSDVLVLMERLAARLAAGGWGLRSGGADGADSAFETGCDSVFGEKQIFIPWNAFQGRQKGENGALVVPAEILERAMAIASEYHPRWAFLKRGAKMLHTRNVCQVLGPALDAEDRVAFVLCWTKGGQGQGGTGQALRIAVGSGVPILDLGVAGNLHKATAWLNSTLPGNALISG